ncbi:bifunctional 2-C-methyl-D-erythritol 4-phosphate cytidylyltransferase/2-C-methyl-D-erythritol 2,4-cyclodiphosphate synthase [Sphingomonas bacterium]|uniref:bifunctional 2-C-methyl-D-erythritol 4-phosphate cytidylyltransferase/2-C-methyl-D-erythritol 2,4-cyclodiphosphate synthase n=1 Tax=Sphingomonas bacterium TaxID=1895847 RepID=UPI00157673EB|nr:bifunctional 2-C-methyl-D-erythritol 4-phosphate cytidylyltransferase/2-C-methyl-D-erythritol 2,4-cyclodiphosphate synthase [Sphingomonas bacterium]
MSKPRTVALLMAAGRGARIGGDVPKQYKTIGGKAIVAHAFRALARHPAIDEVVVVTADDQRASLAAALGEPAAIVTGGVLRRQSVEKGLAALADDPPARVLIHDAARPFVPGAVIDRLLAALGSHAGAIPVLPLVDTLARSDRVLGDLRLGDTVDRDALYRVQTPQAFVYEAIVAAHRLWPTDRDVTDDAQMVRDAGQDVAIVAGDMMLDKITHPQDIAAAQARLDSASETRMATGFDVHRLEAGEDLWLGGVLIPHDRGLSGHSDADVALHALTDALLGTIAAGDIGTHFPPSDPQWKGASSDRFLRHAAALVEAQGGAIVFVDLTLICEEPKIGPHRAAIRARIAALLELDEARVSIKATTTERLGFTGRGEGIAAQACATVRLPSAGVGTA